MPASVDSKPLTQELNPLDATLTKNRGRGVGTLELTRLGISRMSSRIYLFFQLLTQCPFCKSFVLKFIQNAGGVGGRVQ